MTARWTQIKRDFMRTKAMGDGDADVGQRVVAQLNDLVEGVRALEKPPVDAASLPQRSDNAAPWPQILASLERLSERLGESRTAGIAEIEVSTPANASLPDWFERHAEQQLQLQQVLTLLAERIAAQTVAIQNASMQGGPQTAAKRGRTAPTEGAALAASLREEQLKQALDEFSDRLLGKTQR
jgi:hypothetical protein